MEMLNSLEALAGKISPGSGKNSPSHQQQQQQFDSNANKITAAGHLAHLVHPYHKQQQQQQDQHHNREK